METLFQMFIPLYIYKYPKDRIFIQTKDKMKNRFFSHVCKVKVLFGVTQLKQEEITEVPSKVGL